MRYLLTLILSLFAASAHAQGVATFFYQRGTIGIVRANAPAAPALPWQGADAPPAPVNPTFSITADIRPGSSLTRQDGWVNMTGLEGGSGMLFVFDKPQRAHIGHMEYYQPLDVLWVDENGTITSIAPGLVLAEQKEAIIDPKPSKAILLLAGGSSAQNGIAPGDKITGSDYFTVLPQVLKMDVPKPKASPAQTKPVQSAPEAAVVE